MTDKPMTGIDALRLTVRARNRSPHALSLIAREVAGVSASDLEDFANGKIDLTVAQLKALAPVVHPFAEYDPELNLLRSANRDEPKLAGIPPPPFKPTPKVYQVGVLQGPGPQPVNPQPPAKPKRTGWLKRWS